ncbi:hypothetical protein NO1_2301, partial [Candidatus Termititenax aidoneus]
AGIAGATLPIIMGALGTTSQTARGTLLGLVVPGAGALLGIALMAGGAMIGAALAGSETYKATKDLGLAAQLTATVTAGAAAAITGMLIGAAAVAAVATPLLAAVVTAGVGAAVAGAGTAAGIMLGATVVNIILGKLPAMVSGTITMQQDQNRAETAQEKWREISQPKAEAAASNARQGQSSAKEVSDTGIGIYNKVKNNAASGSAVGAMASNMVTQYSLLKESAGVSFRKGPDGLIYDNDEKFIVLERDLGRLQNINRLITSLHAAKAQARNAVHTEMTSQSGYTTSQLASSLTEQEQSIIMEKFNELKTLRQEYLSAYNAGLQAAANAQKLTTLVKYEATAMV